MNPYKIGIEWEGPLRLKEVIEKKNDAGVKPCYGEDYGLYQIYGKHLCGKDVLLYIGKATERTFSSRVDEHKKSWLDKDQREKNIRIHLGRIYDSKKHSYKDGWKSWKRDVELAEELLIYLYSPNYNSSNISTPPKRLRQKEAHLIHKGNKGKLFGRDDCPKDFSRRW
jgi:hypothetical protein